MQTTLIPFNELLENITDDTGISDITNLEERIRRWVFRASQRLGYSGAQVFKSLVYTKGTSWSGKSLSLPTDCLLINDVYIDDERINNNQYRQYGNNVTFRDTYTDATSLKLYYYGIMHDTEGNPACPRGHADALSAYCVWKMIGAKVFLEPTRYSRRVVRDYEQEWRDERDAAQGEEAFAMNDEDYEILSTIRNFSTKDAIIYYPHNDYENEAIMESKEECVLKPEEMDINVYVWQFDDRTTDIAFAPSISQVYLDDNATKYELEVFKIGVIVPYNTVGRIAFAIQGGTDGQYRIYDTFNSDVTDLVFDQYYDDILNLDIYISKEFYANSNIFFKLKEA